jgi:hypothetical protein
LSGITLAVLQLHASVVVETMVALVEVVVDVVSALDVETSSQAY